MESLILTFRKSKFYLSLSKKCKKKTINLKKKSSDFEIGGLFFCIKNAVFSFQLIIF